MTGPQFEDDLNVFTLRRATVVDVFGGRTIARSISAFVAVENLFDIIYDVGRTPVLTTGLPRIGAGGRASFLAVSRSDRVAPNASERSLLPAASARFSAAV